MGRVTLFLTLASALAATAGQVLLRFSQSAPGGAVLPGGVRLSWWLAAGLACHGTAAALWAAALARAPLSALYPVTATTQVLVPVAAWVLLREPLGPRTWLAAALAAGSIILSGVPDR